MEWIELRGPKLLLLLQISQKLRYQSLGITPKSILRLNYLKRTIVKDGHCENFDTFRYDRLWKLKHLKTYNRYQSFIKKGEATVKITDVFQLLPPWEGSMVEFFKLRSKQQSALNPHFHIEPIEWMKRKVTNCTTTYLNRNWQSYKIIQSSYQIREIN